MRRLIMSGVVCLAAFSLVSAAWANDDRCKDVNGHFVLTVIPAPNDPMGRVLGASTGDLKAAISVSNISETTAFGVWVLGPQDILIFNGSFSAAPIPGEPVGTISISATLTSPVGQGSLRGRVGLFKVPARDSIFLVRTLVRAALTLKKSTRAIFAGCAEWTPKSSSTSRRRERHSALAPHWSQMFCHRSTLTPGWRQRSHGNSLRGCRSTAKVQQI
jgi:hypothetical protein